MIAHPRLILSEPATPDEAGRNGEGGLSYATGQCYTVVEHFEGESRVHCAGSGAGLVAERFHSMLTLWGGTGRRAYCDGVSRRSFLKVGGLAMGGLGLPELLEAEAGGGTSAAGSRASSHKSVIMVYLSGGLAHQDTFDLKPDAPAEDPRRVQADRHAACPASRSASCCRGSAAVMDKLAVIRSLVGQRDEHSSFQSMTGFPMDISPARGEAALRLGRREGAGPGRPGRAAVRRPVPDDAAQAVQHPRPRPPRPAYRAGEDGRRRPGRS